MHVSVLDATESLRRHPSVSNVDGSPSSDGVGFVVTADIDTNLPSTWKAQGHNPNGVRPIETVEIYFPADYPNSAPYPTLRPDFDASLPHINPHRAGGRVPPCIYQGSLLDALHNEGFGRLVLQLVDWLEKPETVRSSIQSKGGSRCDERGATMSSSLTSKACRNVARLWAVCSCSFWTKYGGGNETTHMPMHFGLPRSLLSGGVNYAS